MAAQMPEAAVASFTLAQSLDPSDYRWPYYLGQLARSQGDLPKASGFFDRVFVTATGRCRHVGLVRRPRSGGWQGRSAEPMFAKALQLEPQSVSARYGAGRAALARGDNKKAVEMLEDVLRLNPKATAAHYPLSQAYAALGDNAKAAEHLRLRWGRSHRAA